LFVTRNTFQNSLRITSVEKRTAAASVDPNADIFECDAEEIAKQLTLQEWKMWITIKPYEFLDLAWTKKDKSTRACNGMKRFQSLLQSEIIFS
jgi:hypothetical protein